MHALFKGSGLYKYYEQVLSVDVPPSDMLEKFDNWLFNVEGHDTYDHPEVLLSHLFAVYRTKYAAYALEAGEKEFDAMMHRHFPTGFPKREKS